MVQSLQMMKNNSQHYKGYEKLINRIDDYSNQAIKCGVFYTSFLLDDEISVIKRYLGKKFNYDCFGGYENSEKKVLKIIHDEYYHCDFPIKIIRAKYDERYYNISHRDVLGSIMSLGVNINSFGDIIVSDGNIYIMIIETMSDFFINELIKIKNCKVKFELYDGKIQYNQEFECYERIITSNRLDSIVASCVNLSREKAKILIGSQRVKVNHQLLEDSKFLCDNSSVISIKGFGRYKVEFSNRKTKKNKLVIMISKYK